MSRPPANRGSSFLDSVAQTMHEPLSLWDAEVGGSILTSLSSTHLLSSCSGLRQCHSCWLLLSRHFQCFRNSSRQFLLMSSKLHKNSRISLVSRLHPKLLPFAPPSPSIPSHQSPHSPHCCYPFPPSRSSLHYQLLSENQIERIYSHTSRTPRDLPSFPHTINLPPPPRILLAFHIIIIECATTSTNEE